MIDVSDTIVAKSDQLNADDLVGGPITVKITKVNKPGGDQPITINYEGDNGRPFKPCKTVRRILVKAWGKDASQWIGRLMTLYCETSVKWAGKEVGGTRISHLSHIDGKLEISLTETRGSKKGFTIKPIPTSAPTQGAPAPATGTPTNGANVKLVKADGSEVKFDTFESWIAFMQNNLPKIQDLARIESFSSTHQAIFDELRNTGFEVWADQAEKLVAENKKRLGGGDDAGL